MTLRVGAGSKHSHLIHIKFFDSDHDAESLCNFGYKRLLSSCARSCSQYSLQYFGRLNIFIHWFYAERGTTFIGLNQSEIVLKIWIKKSLKLVISHIVETKTISSGHSARIKLTNKTASCIKIIWLDLKLLKNFWKYLLQLEF